MEPELTHYQKYKVVIYKNVVKSRLRSKNKKIKENEDKIIKAYLEKQIQNCN